MGKFQCLSERELPEDSKTHPTFIPSAIFEGVMSIKNINAFFLGHPVALSLGMTFKPLKIAVENFLPTYQLRTYLV